MGNYTGEKIRKLRNVRGLSKDSFCKTFKISLKLLEEIELEQIEIPKKLIMEMDNFFYSNEKRGCSVYSNSKRAYY